MIINVITNDYTYFNQTDLKNNVNKNRSEFNQIILYFYSKASLMLTN